MQSEKWNLNRLDLWAEVALNLLNEAGAVFKGDDSYLAPRHEAALSAPSVAVKALEWKKTPASEDALPEWTSHDPKDGMYTVAHDGRDWRVVRHFIVIGRKKTLQDAKELAQSHYEARIPSALSAQVQDVAGTETTTRFYIEWIAGARPPAHPKPMTGRASFETFERALQHMKNQADDAQFVSLEERRTTVVSVDRSADMRAALTAAPAKQEGGTNE
ncbi:hypothetical protein [Agrobacterium pusense]|uniref:hypothetical protein n=1 Tax=Agrobacterium pusense TaxID=648995 RepID=UPI00345E7630